MLDHPIRLVVSDDLRRSRLTVLFRLLLVLPHVIWLFVWWNFAILAAFLNWVATLVLGRSPRPLHRFLAAYVRYNTHVGAYFILAGNPFPGFVGKPGYPIDVQIDPPARQNRWVTGFRLILVLPALFIYFTIGGNYISWMFFFIGSTIVFVLAVFLWFVGLILGRAPRGFRNLLSFYLRYSAQLAGYLFLLTDRYPDSDPTMPASAGAPEPDPIRLEVTDDRRRSRLTVLFRLLLALPHIVWLYLWSVLAYLAVLVNWFATLFMGRSPQALHRFLAAFVRYQVHVGSYVTLVANPFPGFTGKRGYPVDLEIDPPERQSRWVTFFRLLLVFPAVVIAGTLGYALFMVAFLGWFAALITGRMPKGLRNLGAYLLAFWARVYGYLYLLTDRYPHSSPPAERVHEPEPPVAEAA